MNWDSITKFITTIGLPAAFAIFLLWFVTHKMDKEVTQAMQVQQAMLQEIQKCCSHK